MILVYLDIIVLAGISQSFIFYCNNKLIVLMLKRDITDGTNSTVQ